jgi:hypothetical protein
MHDGVEITGEFFADSHIEKWIKSDEKITGIAHQADN